MVGTWDGNPTAKAKSQQVVELIGPGLTKKAVAEELEIGVASVYRILRSKFN